MQKKKKKRILKIKGKPDLTFGAMFFKKAVVSYIIIVYY